MKKFLVKHRILLSSTLIILGLILKTTFPIPMQDLNLMTKAELISLKRSLTINWQWGMIFFYLGSCLLSVALLFPLKKTKRRYLTAVIAIYILVFTALSGIKDYRQSSMEEKAEEKVAGTIVEKNDTFHLAGFLTDKDANSRYHSTEPSIYFFYTEKASPSIGEKLTITIKGASWQENGRTMVKVISMQQ